MALTTLMETFLKSISTENSKNSRPSDIQELLKNTAEKIKQLKDMDRLTSQLAAQVPTEMLQNAYSHIKGDNSKADEKTKQIQADAWAKAKTAFEKYKTNMEKAGTEKLFKDIAREYTETRQPPQQQQQSPQQNGVPAQPSPQITVTPSLPQNIQQQTVTPPVVQQSTGSDDMKTIEQLGSCVNPSNITVFMEFIVRINDKMEKLKSLRDWKMSKNAENNGGINNVEGEYDEEKDLQIYTYDDHKSFITSDKIDSYKSDTEKSSEKNKESELRMLDGVKAQNEIYSRLKQSNIGAFSATEAVKYLGFNVGAFDAKMEEVYKVIDSKTASAEEKDKAKGSVTDYATFGGTKFKQEGEYVSAGDSNDVDTTSALDKNDAVQDNPIYEGITRAIDGVNSLLDCLSDDSIKKIDTNNTGLKSSNFVVGSASDAANIYALVSQAKSIVEKITQLNESRKEGNLFSWDNLFVLSDLLNELGGVSGTIISVVNRVPGLSKVVQNNIKSTGNVLQILNGLFTLADSAKAIGEANAGIATAEKSQETIEKIINKESVDGVTGSLDENEKKQAARFAMMAKRAEDKQRHDRALAVLDNATGLMDIGAGVASFFPGAGTAIGAGLGLLSSATSFFGKLIINGYFKRRQIKDTFDELLGGKGELDKYMDRLKKASQSPLAPGRDAKKKFHEVLRRATGFSTRAKYADAIAATNAIDLYTAAKATPIIDNDSNAAQSVVINTMASMGIGKEKFRTMKLDDILKGVDAKTDWKGAIKDAITQSADFVEEDIKSGVLNTAIEVKKFDDKADNKKAAAGGK